MIEVKGLSFSYPGAEEPALHGIDFQVQQGEIFGFLGPNGAGKSTTQKVLIGLLDGYAGDVRVLGKDRLAWNDRFFEYVGVGFEQPNHYRKLTGLENLRLFASLYSTETEEPEALLDWVDLADAGDRRVSDYSKGMQVRLSMARALLNRPQLLFLDEPTAGLDPVSTQRIEQLILDQRDAGRTVFLTTHNMAEADALCDRVAFIVDGEISLIDAPRALKLDHGQHQVRVEYRRPAKTLEPPVGAHSNAPAVSPAESEDDNPSEAVDPPADPAAEPDPAEAAPPSADTGELQTADFPLEGLGENEAFLRILREAEVETIHSLEASLADIFAEVTGRSLR